MPTKIQVYMILSAVGTERGAPTHVFYDPFKARAHFATIDDIVSAFTGSYTAFLVAYEIGADGTLTELQEIGRK